MVRVQLVIWRLAGRRRQTLVVFLIAAAAVFLLARVYWLVNSTAAALLPPPPLSHHLQHLRTTRNLKHYMDNIQLFIEPSSTPCEGPDGVRLLVLVASSPDDEDRRWAIRETWGSRLPTYFVMGLDQIDDHGQLSNVYIEAKQFSDMVVFELVESYQNLTLKSALMLQWSRRRCPQAEALLKTDDDVLINPWMLKEVIKEHANHQLIGYKRNQTAVHRDQYTKWYMPRWLYPQETIPEYLSGTGYIINGEYIERILKAAYKVPLVNLEDVFFTSLVARGRLGLTLTHDRRVSPFKPWIRSGCALWGLAAAHSLAAEEMVKAWEMLLPLGEQFERGGDVCGFFSFLSGDFFLY